mmetsp:Transcript_2014/g.6359  ORF Transcript_2014/g.6359 Transcript_2014/m.6359 type:complete len:287 (-) Transcript_2014:866-1726(-)
MVEHLHHPLDQVRRRHVPQGGTHSWVPLHQQRLVHLHHGREQRKAGQEEAAHCVATAGRQQAHERVKGLPLWQVYQQHGSNRRHALAVPNLRVVRCKRPQDAKERSLAPAVPSGKEGVGARLAINVQINLLADGRVHRTWLVQQRERRQVVGPVQLEQACPHDGPHCVRHTLFQSRPELGVLQQGLRRREHVSPLFGAGAQAGQLGSRRRAPRHSCPAVASLAVAVAVLAVVRLHNKPILVDQLCLFRLLLFCLAVQLVPLLIHGTDISAGRHKRMRQPLVVGSPR